MRQRSGFTLVELSIVLVIIGLLIGGILAAQSMIATSKINATVRQIGQFDASVMSFETKFNFMPGDAPSFGGNGDGRIENDSSTGDATAFIGEIGRFWSDLYPESFVASPYPAPGLPAKTIGINATVPASKIGADGSFYIASVITSTGVFSSASDTRNFYVILDGTHLKTINANNVYRMAATSATNSALKPLELLAIDKKVDDGLADSGNIISGSVPHAYDVGGAIVATPAAGTCSSNADYLVANNNYECTPLIRIGSSVGVPQ